jgi:hypothetical protein
MDLRTVLMINFTLKKAKKPLSFLPINRIESWKIVNSIKHKKNNKLTVQSLNRIMKTVKLLRMIIQVWIEK